MAYLDYNGLQHLAGIINKQTGRFDPAYLFEFGNIDISTNGWSYSISGSRVRTKVGTTLTLKQGDVIGLRDYSNARFFIGWMDSEGNYKTPGSWKTSDYTITEDGQYVVLLSNRTETDQTSVDDLAGLFFGYSLSVYDYLEENRKSVQHLTKAEVRLYAGYIASDGSISRAGNEDEVYTDIFPCEAGDEIEVHFSNPNKKGGWYAYALYDINGVFISRSVLSSGTGMYPNYRITIEDSSAKYIAFSYRRYNGEITFEVFMPRVSLFTEGKVIDLLKQPVTRTESLAVLIPAQYGAYPTINSTARTLTIKADTLLLMRPLGAGLDSATIQLAPNNDRTIDFSNINSTAIKIYYNTETDTFVPRVYSAMPTRNEVLIAALRIAPGSNSYGASMSCPFYIDGQLFGVDLNVLIDKDISALNPNINSVNHRGYNTVAPENTLPAFKLSKANGFSMVETDVSFTSDDVAVCLHDSTINRTARNSDGTEIANTINISDITYAQALTYDFGIWKGAAYAGTKIPTFEEFIVLCRNLGLHPYIELKTGTQSQIEGLVDIVEACGMSGKVTWISFSASLLTYVKNYDAEARLGYIITSVTSTAITTAEGLKTTKNEIFIDSDSYTAEDITLCRNAHIPLEVWTINSVSTIDNLDPYITGVTSDSLIAGYELYKANI